jgi:hypothetical protein
MFRKPAQSGQLIGRFETETQLNTRSDKDVGARKQDKNEEDAINSLGLYF